MGNVASTAWADLEDEDREFLLKEGKEKDEILAEEYKTWQLVGRIVDIINRCLNLST